MGKISLKDIIIIFLLIIILILSIFLVKAQIDLKVKEQNIEIIKRRIEGKGPEIYIKKVKEFEANFKIIISLYTTKAGITGGSIDDESGLDLVKQKCKEFKGKPVGSEYKVDFYDRMIYAKLPYEDTEYILKFDMKSKKVKPENPPEGAFDWD